jgi:hypothetical protein
LVPTPKPPVAPHDTGNFRSPGRFAAMSFTGSAVMTSLDDMLRSAVECLRSAEKAKDHAEFNLLLQRARQRIAAAKAIRNAIRPEPRHRS